MCNEIRRTIALGEIRDDFAELRIPLRFPEGAPNFEPADSIRITDRTPIVRWKDHGAALVTRRWSWPGPNRRPVYNYRSEGRRFENTATSGRCLIPASGFYEFTAAAPPARRKTKWLFTDAAHRWFAIAGLWRAEPALSEDAAGEAFTMLTTTPGEDIAAYHDRQIVILPREGWRGWLDGDTPAAELCKPASAGTLRIERMSS